MNFNSESRIEWLTQSVRVAEGRRLIVPWAIIIKIIYFNSATIYLQVWSGLLIIFKIRITGRLFGLLDLNSNENFGKPSRFKENEKL